MGVIWIVQVVVSSRGRCVCRLGGGFLDLLGVEIKYSGRVHLFALPNKLVQVKRAHDVLKAVVAPTECVLEALAIIVRAICLDLYIKRGLPNGRLVTRQPGALLDVLLGGENELGKPVHTTREHGLRRNG